MSYLNLHKDIYSSSFELSFHITFNQILNVCSGMLCTYALVPSVLENHCYAVKAKMRLHLPVTDLQCFEAQAVSNNVCTQMEVAEVGSGRRCTDYS